MCFIGITFQVFLRKFPEYDAIHFGGQEPKFQRMYCLALWNKGNLGAA